MAAYRNGGSRVEFDDRETFISERGPRRPRDDVEIYERREERRSQSRGPPVVIRDREIDRESRVPAFLREDVRRSDAGPLVLRQREVETVERPRRRSPSPVRLRETRIVERARSVSPAPPPRRIEEDVRVRTVERERVRSPSRGPAVDRIRTRIVERERSPSPPPVPIERVRTRIVERGRSPSPIDRERERIRIVERQRERIPSPSPSPPPPPPVIKGPTIEREVITHYRDIDHGMIPAPRPPSPPPPPRARSRARDTEIDIYTSRSATDVEITKSARPRGRSISRERPSPARFYNEDRELVVRSDRDRLEVAEHRSASRRRAHSAAPPMHDYDEAEYITSRIDSRGRMGEAWGGATKDWTIVDVPPGTERVRMDGVGGGSAEVGWQKYSGVRRSKFIPERDRDTVVSTSSTSISDREVRERDRERESRLSVQIYDKDRDVRDRTDVEVEKVTDRRISIRGGPPAPPPAPRRSEMWTEITKDLIVREAIEELGYEYEETEYLFYVMQYLRYEDVLELVQVSDTIRRSRKDRVREIQYEREIRDDWDREYRHRRRHHHSHSADRFEDERVVEREVVYDRPPVRGYLR